MQKYDTDHEQLLFFTLEGEETHVDKGMFKVLFLMRDLGLRTQYSCEGAGRLDLAYVVMDQRSAWRFEKMLRNLNLTTVSLMTADKFLRAAKIHDVCISYTRRARGEDFRVWREFYRHIFRPKGPRGDRFVIERSYQLHPHWLRTTYRWDPKWTPHIEDMLVEIHNKTFFA